MTPTNKFKPGMLVQYKRGKGGREVEEYYHKLHGTMIVLALDDKVGHQKKPGAQLYSIKSKKKFWEYFDYLEPLSQASQKLRKDKKNEL